MTTRASLAHLPTPRQPIDGLVVVVAAADLGVGVGVGVGCRVRGCRSKRHGGRNFPVESFLPRAWIGGYGDDRCGGWAESVGTGRYVYSVLASKRVQSLH